MESAPEPAHRLTRFQFDLISAMWIPRRNVLVIGSGLAFLYLWLWPGWATPVAPDWYHESDQLAPAADFLKGQVPFRDIFIAQGLGHNILKPAAGYLLFGESVASKQLMDRLLYPFGLIGLALLAAAGLGWGWSWFITILILPHVFPYFPDRHFLAGAGLAALLFAQTYPRDDRKRLLLFILAGGAASAQFFNSMELGAITLTLGIMFSAASEKSDRRRASVLFLAGAAAVAAPVVIYLSLNGALDDFIWNTAIRLFTHAQYEGIPYHWPTWNMNPLRNPIYLWHLPLLFMAAGTLTVVWLRSRLSRPELSTGVLLTGTAVLMFIPAFTHGDFEHLSFSAPYSVVLALWVGKMWAARIHKGWVIAAGAVILIYATNVQNLHGKLPLHILSRWDNLKTFRQIKPPMDNGAPNVVLTKGEMEVIDEISRLSPTGGKILNLTTEGPFNFLAGKMNLCRYYLPDYIYDEKMEKEVISHLEETADAVILTPKDMASLEARSGYPLPRLKAHLAAHYRPRWSGEKYTLWR